MSWTTPRRILVLNERDPDHPKAGGAEIHVAEIFSRLAARGHHVRWLVSGFRGAARRTILDGMHLERCGALPRYYGAMPLRVRRACAAGGAGGKGGKGGERGIDLVVDCLNKVPFHAPLYAGRPVLALCHHLFGEVAFQQVAWPIAAGVFLAERGLATSYRNCLFVAISESSRDDLVARGIAPERIRLSHPGIRRPERKVLPEAPRPCRIAYVGRLERYKRVDVLLEAAAALVDRFPELEIVVIGRGPERARLEHQASDLGLAQRIRFTGFAPDAERDALLAETRACVFASEKEGWGLTVIEANALATPVVASDVPGLRDSVRHEQTGLLVPAGDVPAFAEALGRLLAEDAFSLAMRRAAYEWSQHFDWSRAADEMAAAIEEALARA